MTETIDKAALIKACDGWYDHRQHHAPLREWAPRTARFLSLVARAPNADAHLALLVSGATYNHWPEALQELAVESVRRSRRSFVKAATVETLYLGVGATLHAGASAAVLSTARKMAEYNMFRKVCTHALENLPDSVMNMEFETYLKRQLKYLDEIGEPTQAWALIQAAQSASFGTLLAGTVAVVKQHDPGRLTPALAEPSWVRPDIGAFIGMESVLQVLDEQGVATKESVTVQADDMSRQELRQCAQELRHVLPRASTLMMEVSAIDNNYVRAQAVHALLSGAPPQAWPKELSALVPAAMQSVRADAKRYGKRFSNGMTAVAATGSAAATGGTVYLWHLIDTRRQQYEEEILPAMVTGMVQRLPAIAQNMPLRKELNAMAANIGGARAGWQEQAEFMVGNTAVSVIAGLLGSVLYPRLMPPRAEQAERNLSLVPQALQIAGALADIEHTLRQHARSTYLSSAASR